MANFEDRNGRLIIVKNCKYKWTCGKQFVVIYSEDNKGRMISAAKLTGRDFERGQHKKTQDGMVTPSDVEKYINKLNENYILF
jgi:hypothetical protein